MARRDDDDDDRDDDLPRSRRRDRDDDDDDRDDDLPRSRRRNRDDDDDDRPKSRRPVKHDDDDDSPPPRAERNRQASNVPKLKVPRWTGLYFGINLFTAIAIICSIALPIIVYKATKSNREITIDAVDYDGNPVPDYRMRRNGPFEDQAALIAGVGALGALSLSMSWVMANLWLYRAWSIVPPKYGGVGPLKAVLLLYVPLFNIYWMFRAIPGLSKAYARMLQDLEPDRKPRTGFGSGVTACVFWLLPGFVALAPFAMLVWLDNASLARNRIELLEAEA